MILMTSEFWGFSRTLIIVLIKLHGFTSSFYEAYVQHTKTAYCFFIFWYQYDF